MDWSLPVQHPTDIFSGTVEALTDVTVVSPIVKTSLLHSNPKFPAPQYKPAFFVQPKTYFYVFGHQTEDGEYSARLGCITGEDLAYVFGAPLVMSLAHFGANFTSDETALSEIIMMHWASFAKYGYVQSLYNNITLKAIKMSDSKLHNNYTVYAHHTYGVYGHFLICKYGVQASILRFSSIFSTLCI